MSKTTIHRPTKTGQDWFWWFEFKGERYEVRRQAPGRPQTDGYGYMIVRVSDLTVVDEGFAYLSEIRDLLSRAYAEDWPSLSDAWDQEHRAGHDHGPEVGVDWANGLVLHENDEDWHPWDASVYGAIEQSPEPPMSETHRAQAEALERYAAHTDTMPSPGVREAQAHA